MALVESLDRHRYLGLVVWKHSVSIGGFYSMAWEEQTELKIATSPNFGKH